MNLEDQIITGEAVEQPVEQPEQVDAQPEIQAVTYNPDGIPPTLKELKIWALSAPGQVNVYEHPFSEKAPLFRLLDGIHCRGINPTVEKEWRPFDEMDLQQRVIGGYPGLMVSHGFIGIDFDFKDAPPEYVKWVFETVIPHCPKSFHVEHSPSGNGVRIIAFDCTLPENRKTATLEMYSHSRFLRMTGAIIDHGATEMEPQAFVDFLWAQLPPVEESANEGVVELVGAMPSVEERQAASEAMLQFMDADKDFWFGDLEALKQAGHAEKVGSDAGHQATISLAKYATATKAIDATMAFGLLCSLGHVMAHYEAKHGERAQDQLLRKFQTYWWPDAMGMAPSRIAEQKAEIEANKDFAEGPLKALNEGMREKWEREQAEKEEEHKQREAEIRAQEAEVELERQPIDLDELPVKIMRDYEQWARGSVLETETSIVRAAVLTHLSSLIARSYKTHNGSLLNLYMIILAIQGAGKEVLSAAYQEMTRQMGLGNNLIDKPESNVAFHLGVQRRPSGLMVQKETGDRFTEWRKQGSPTRLLPTILKDMYGINSGNEYLGSSYADYNKNIAPIISPAPTFLGEGTRNQVLDALGDFGTEDGFIGRFLFVEGGDDYIDNDHGVVREMPPALIEGLKTILTKEVRDCLANLGAPNTKQVECSDAAKEVFAELKAEERKAKRDKDNPNAGSWRAATQNAEKIAAVLAVYDNPTAPLISDVHARWAEAFVRRSIQVAIAHREIDGAYGDADHRAARALEKMIRNFFSEAGAKRGKAKQQELRSRGLFTTGYLGEKLAGIKNHPRGSAMGLDIAVKILREEERIVYGTDDKGKGYFSRGERWGAKD